MQYRPTVWYWFVRKIDIQPQDIAKLSSKLICQNYSLQKHLYQWVYELISQHKWEHRDSLPMLRFRYLVLYGPKGVLI